MTIQELQAAHAADTTTPLRRANGTVTPKPKRAKVAPVAIVAPEVALAAGDAEVVAVVSLTSSTPLTLPRVADTKKFAKFQADANGGAFGAVYVPLENATGLTQVTVILG